MSITPKRLFLLDGLGACLTACLLFFVVARYEAFFGMPRQIVYGLSAIAALFAIYSFSCYALVERQWRTCLRGIAVANLLYCVGTFGLVLFYWQRLTGWGVSYFLGEIAVIVGLVAFEWKATAHR